MLYMIYKHWQWPVSFKHNTFTQKYHVTVMWHNFRKKNAVDQPIEGRCKTRPTQQQDEYKFRHARLLPSWPWSVPDTSRPVVKYVTSHGKKIDYETLRLSVTHLSAQNCATVISSRVVISDDISVVKIKMVDWLQFGLAWNDNRITMTDWWPDCWRMMTNVAAKCIQVPNSDDQSWKHAMETHETSPI